MIRYQNQHPAHRSITAYKMWTSLGQVRCWEDLYIAETPFRIYYSPLGWWDASAGKGTCCQAWRSEFNPWDPRWERKTKQNKNNKKLSQIVLWALHMNHDTGLHTQSRSNKNVMPLFQWEFRLIGGWIGDLHEAAWMPRTVSELRSPFSLSPLNLPRGPLWKSLP